MGNIVKKILLGITIVILTLIVICFGILYFTPGPLFTLANLVPVEANLTKPENYSTIESSITVEQNILYSENYPNSSLDIYFPKLSTEKFPVIFFVHGGGFFKGEKEMAKYFGPTLSDSQYAFVSIDYNLVPNATVFDQIKQVNEAFKFIVENADKYSFDTSKINLAGSSAGGFLVLQLLSAYYDKGYAEELEIDTVKNMNIKSILLYSAVYDLSAFQSFEGNVFENYIMAKLGWGLTGEKNWKNDRELGESLNLNNFMSYDFPPMFITDGNTQTFTEQAKNYIHQLEEQNIPVQELFFDSQEKVGHGYQLNMASEASKKAIFQSLDFLNYNN
ncbi:alpha/beta hydrolase [Enterococcus sp. LJL120]